jgi:hypothetical protein
MALLPGLFFENSGQIIVNRQRRSHASIIAYYNLTMALWKTDPALLR